MPMLGFVTAPATGKFEFGLAVYGTACLFIDEKLIIDNTAKQSGGRFFFGKGTVEERQVVELVEGQSYKIKVEFGSSPTTKLVKPGVVQFGGGAGRIGMAAVIDENEAILRAMKLAKENKYTILMAGLSVSLFNIFTAHMPLLLRLLS